MFLVCLVSMPLVSWDPIFLETKTLETVATEGSISQQGSVLELAPTDPLAEKNTILGIFF